MTALTEILAWSASAPAWLRDALRRVVSSSPLVEADFAELAELCKTPHGLSAGGPVPDCLAEHHIPASPTGGAVGISAITHISDVNALAPNETLSFAPIGLTVIYGDNGAGKSSFTRILRRICRARGGNVPILANALSNKPAGAPTARVDYVVGGDPRVHTWKDGIAADAELGAISVFDASAAQVYLAEETEVRFRPFGLDVTDRAASVCLRVKKVLEAEVEALRAHAITLPAVPSTTEAGRLLAGLTALTPAAEVDRLGTLSDDEQTELDTLTDILAAAKAEDPKKKAAELALKVGRLRRLLGGLQDLADAISDARVTNVEALASAAAKAADEEQRVAAKFAREVVLAGAGSAEWNALWGAAKAYSESRAYPEQAFPHVAEGAACVLCQQDLGPHAQARMHRFAEFVLGGARECARRAKHDAEKARQAIIELRPGDRDRDVLAELGGISTEVASKVEAFMASARECHADVTASVASPRRCSSRVPVAELEAVIVDLENRAAAFARAADPGARAKSEQRQAELAARRTLGRALTDVHAEINRRARLNAYDQCLKDTDTRALTKLGVELTRKYVTEALTASFAAELAALGFTELELELKPASAQRGQLFHKIQLKHATRADLPKVVSDGESRCIALAAFMAELLSSGQESGIIFDDPVSSLDHRWRSSVARRLVQAARTRPVVVFTHELVFLSELLHEAEKADVPAETRTVTRDRLHAGHVMTGLPWHGVPTKKRIGLLRNRWVAADKAFRVSGQEAYDPLATLIYADLRRTWERATEEILLNQVVLRFRPGVETQRLKKLADITAEDLDAVDGGMTKCSKWEGGHDQALAMNQHPPQPSELEQDIDALETWIGMVEKRRK